MPELQYLQDSQYRPQHRMFFSTKTRSPINTSITLSGDASPTTKETGLLGLPLDIVRTVFEEVYHDDFRAFMTLSRVSKDCRRECERLLFRSLTMDEKNIRAAKCDLRIVDRLQDPEDTLAEHVRHVRIGPLYYKEAMAPVVLSALPHLTKLQSFHWNSHLPLPLNVLQDLYELCPSAQLHVTNRDRRFPVPLSRPLLSFPRLHTVDINAYYVYRGHQPPYSEFDILKTCLIHGESVKVLRLGAWRARVPKGCDRAGEPGYDLEHWEGVTAGTLNFHWQEGDRFPPLEELKLDRGYNLSLPQCKTWTKCMDWSKLRKLDVDKGAPRYLFEVLTGEVPQLKSLAFGQSRSQYNIPHFGPTWECEDMSTISKFLGSITALEELVFTAFEYDDFMGTLSVIFEKSGCTLRQFDAHWVYARSNPWTENEFMALLDSCYGLADLSLRFGFHVVRGHWPDERVTARAKYESLMTRERPVSTRRNREIRIM